MFKKIAFSFLLTIFPLFTVSAHYLWVEAQGSGILGQKHQVRVHYGEYTYGVVEQVKGENFPLVSKFTLWLIAPDGSRKELASKAMEDHFQAYFIPSQNGVYTLALNNNEIDVIDYTEYDFGIFKTHYHATAKVRVGGSDADTRARSEEHTSELQSRENLVCRLLLEKKKPRSTWSPGAAGTGGRRCRSRTAR